MAKLSIEEVVECCWGKDLKDATSKALEYIKGKLQSQGSNVSTLSEVQVKARDMAMRPAFVPLNNATDLVRNCLKEGFVICCPDSGPKWDPTPRRMTRRLEAFDKYDKAIISRRKVSLDGRSDESLTPEGLTPEESSFQQFLKDNSEWCKLDAEWLFGVWRDDINKGAEGLENVSSEALPSKRGFLKIGEKLFVYTFAGKEMCWQDHEDAAVKWGGHLASVTNQKEQEYIQKMILTYSAWIGGVRIRREKWSDFGSKGGSKSWKWIDDEKWTWKQHSPEFGWDKGEPNDTDSKQDRVQMYKHNGLWDDLSMREKRPAVYKKEIHVGKPKPGASNEPDDAKDIEYEYKVNQEQMSWQDHEDKAVKEDGHLASITSKDEWVYIKKLVKSGCKTWTSEDLPESNPGKRSVWIGGMRLRIGDPKEEARCSKFWAWSDGAQWDPNWNKGASGWAEGEPNNDGGPCTEDRVELAYNQSTSDLLMNDLSMKEKRSAVYKRRKAKP